MPLRNSDRKEDPGEVAVVRCQIFFILKLYLEFLSFLCLIIDASNGQGSGPLKQSNSSVELGSLYRQVEVSTFGTNILGLL